MSSFIKAEQVVATALGLLKRELSLPQLVWSDAVGDFVGAKDDTISIRVPAYAPARTRALRSGAARTKDGLHERKVDVTLAIDVYKDVPITDEQLSLDIVDFGGQVLNPVIGGIAERLEQVIADVITDSSYRTTFTHDLSSDDPYNTVVAARIKLNDANVPQQGRALVVGSNFEAALLTCDKFVNAASSGTTETLREGLIGRIAGFDVYTSPILPPDFTVAMHKTAFIMAQRAPIVPAGAPWGATSSFNGLAVRTVRVFDADEVEDRFVADSWIGATAVLDDGTWIGGKFRPADEPGATLGEAIALAESAAADDTFDTAAAHGLSAGDAIQLTALTGGTGLAEDTTYYVLATGLTATSFQASATPGGAALGWSADLTEGTVRQIDSNQLVRAVKIVTVA